MLLRPLLLCLWLVPLQQDAAGPDLAPFQNRANTFRISLPAAWRQIAPSETAALAAAIPGLPYDLRQNEPQLFYGVGPVAQWLQGNFEGAYLYVVEQDQEWRLEGDLRERLQQMWANKGAVDGNRYETLAAAKAELGPDRNPAVLAERRIAAPSGRVQRSIDAHVPTGGRQVTLSLVCDERDYDRLEAPMREWLATLQLARRARGEVTLSDKLWTPLLAGAAVGAVLLILYRRTRRPPVSAGPVGS